MHFKRLYINDVQVLDKVYEANSFLERLLGLFAYKKLNAQEALLIKPCSSVHTFFMGYSLSLIFLSDEDRVLKIVNEVKPFRVASCRNAKAVLEALSGPAFEKVSIGDQIKLC